MRIVQVLIQDGGLSPLDTDFRKPFRAIARKVGVNEGTVRRRIAVLEKTGFLKSWWIMANPRLRGEGQVALWIDVPQNVRRTPLVEKLALVPGAILVGRFFGTLLTLILQFSEEGSLRRTIELISRFSEATDSYVGKVPFPECKIVLSATDRRMLRSIQSTPRKPLGRVAEDLGLSSRTVGRRLQRLIQERAVFALPRIDPRALDGGVLAALTVFYSVDRKAETDARLYAKLKPHLWHVLHTLPFEAAELAASAFNLMLPNVASAQDILEWTRDQNEIEAARVDLHEEIRAVPETLEALLREAGHDVQGASEASA